MVTKSLQVLNSGDQKNFWNIIRIKWYAVAFLLRVVISAIFIDHADGQVLLETGKDIIVDGRNFYYEGSLQSEFNYFPLAYLPVLTGLGLYYLLELDNIILERIFLRLPMNIADLILSYLIVYYINKFHGSKELDKSISGYENLILFNPFIIYAGSYKGQFDIFVVLFAMIGLIFFRNKNYSISGMFLGLSFLIKQYSALISFFCVIFLVKKEIIDSIKFVLGHLLSVIPILSIFAFFNFSGMIKHAIMYHVNRTASGYSITFYLVYLPPRTLNNVLSPESIYSFQMAVTKLSYIILVGIFLYLGIKLFLTTDSSYSELFRIILISYISFFLINKIFWFQYVIIGIMVLMLNKIERGEQIPQYWINWSINMIPLILIWRPLHFTPDDIRILLGDYWIYLITIFGLTIHFGIISIQYLKHKDLFVKKSIKILYGVIIISQPFNLWNQLRFL